VATPARRLTPVIGGVVIPVHLVVHVLGLAVTAGLVVVAVTGRRRCSPSWPALAAGSAALATSHVAAGGLLVADVPWPVYVRAVGYALVAVGVGGRWTGDDADRGTGGAGAMPIAVVLAPPAVHVAAAVAGLLAAASVVRGALGRGRDVVTLAGGLVLWAAADQVVQSRPGVAAGLSVAGSLAAGAWLVQRARTSLLSRFLVASVAVLLVLVSLLAAAGGAVFSLDLQREQLDRLDDLAAVRAAEVAQDWPDEVRALAALFSSGERINAELVAIGTGEAVSLDGRAAAIASLPDADAALLVDDRGRVVGSFDRTRPEPGPFQPADELVLAGDTLVLRALTGVETAGVVALGDGRLVAVGVAPVAPVGEEGTQQLDRVAGALLVARAVTDPSYVAEVAVQTDAGAAVVVDGEVVVASPGLDATALQEALALDAATGTRDVGPERAYVAVAPIADGTGARVGSVVLVQPSDRTAAIERDATRSLFLVALAGLAIAAVLAVLAARQVTAPVARLTRAAERVAEGDLGTRLGTDRVDEVGRLAGAFDEMTVSLSAREDDLRRAARTEADLRRRLEVVTSSMGEALVAVDPAGTVTTANPAAAALLGEGLLGRSLREVLRGTDETGRPLVHALGAADESGPAAVRGSVTRGRRPVPVAASAAPLATPEGARLGRVYVLRDISGEVEVERMKTEFLSNISHELRTPLTPIKGYSEVLRSKDVGPERTREFASNIASSAQRLERIIGMLVDFAALEAGRMRVEVTDVDLSPVVDRVLATFRERHPDRRFTRRVARGLPTVPVDPDLLARVLEELLDNAVKFSDDTVSILARAGDDGTVELVVRDRGQGLDAEELETILRDFHQADGSATRRYGGLGLGLSIVQRILDRFGAGIEVVSEVDVGTDVVLHLRPEGADR
jgi:signal transduction histidine kinase/HAMP domain-containing protein